MGIDKAKADPRCCILPGHVAEQGRLAGTGLADDVEVHQPVGETNAKGKVAVVAVGLAKQGDVTG